MTSNPSVSGFDMAPALEWYQQNLQDISDNTHRIMVGGSSRSNSDSWWYGGPFVEHASLLPIELTALHRLFFLFPDAARSRSSLRKVVANPPAWFHRDSTPESPKPTTDLEQALSPTAIIPGYTDTSPRRRWTGKQSCDIYLYNLPSFVPYNIRDIIVAHAFIHEMGHTIFNPDFYVGHRTLVLPNGEVMSSIGMINLFADLAEKHPPISHYESLYRNAEGTFNFDDHTRMKVAIAESLCEAIAAYLLGFSFCKDDARSLDPFADRPEIRQFVHDYLHSASVPACHPHAGE